MRTISIVLGDNDFGGVFEPLLLSIMESIKYHAPKEPDREIIRKLIYEGIKFHYFAFHVRHELIIEDWNNEDILYIIEYLKTCKVYFDDEAENDIANNYHDSGAWYLEIETGKVYYY